MADIERVQEVDSADAQVFANDIDLYLSMFCEEQGIDNMRTAPQKVWSAALMYIKNHVFADKSVLKVKGRLTGYDNNISGLNQSNCNAYDTDIVNKICDYYIYICFINNKEVSLNGFSYLTGIETETLRAWGENTTGHYDNKLSVAGSLIYKKLIDTREESLTSKLFDNGHPVGTITILNKHYGYNMPGVRQESSKTSPLNVSQLPKLGADGGNVRQIAQNGNTDLLTQYSQESLQTAEIRDS